MTQPPFDSAQGRELAERPRLGPFLLFAALYALADQLLKWAVVASLQLGESRTLIPGFANLTYLRNRGGAFSLLAGLPEGWGRAFFLVATLAALAFVLYLYRWSPPATRWGRFGLWAIFGGGAGNLVDRALHGEVVDFIDLHAGGYHWPAFNLADSGITVGVILLAVDLFRSRAPGPEDGAGA